MQSVCLSVRHNAVFVETAYFIVEILPPAIY